MIDAFANDLKEIVDHARWRRDDSWSRQWFADFLGRLCKKELFLPPLLAYNLRSAAERGERVMGDKMASIGDPAAWEGFMLWAHAMTVGRLRPAEPSRSPARDAAAFRLASLIAQTLMARIDVSALRTGESRTAFEPAVLLGFEVKRLTGRLINPNPLMQVWSFLEPCVSANRFQEIVSLSGLMAVERRPRGEIDPFLAKLLSSKHERATEATPRVQGSLPIARSQRRFFADFGEFEKRDLGPLPGEMARLAPSELLIYKEGMRRDGVGAERKNEGFKRDDVRTQRKSDGVRRESANARRGADRTAARDQTRNTYRMLFLLRAANSALLQRYHRDTDHSQMEPAVHLQLDLHDEPEDHCLFSPPAPPVISWYRALLVEIAHQFASLAVELGWSTTVSLHRHDGGRIEKAFLESEQTESLAHSKTAALESLVAACPRAFTAARLSPASWVEVHATVPLHVDLWVRVVVGRELSRRGTLPASASHHLQALHQRFARVEKMPSGHWGIEVAETCEPNRRPDITDFPFADASPTTSASVILRKVLRLETLDDGIT